MQDPTELTKICSSEVIFQCKYWVKTSQKIFLVQNSWLGEQVLLFGFVEKMYFQNTLFAKNVPFFVGSLHNDG